MIYNVKLKPARLRTEGKFTAPDPWNGGRSTEWSIEGYVWVPARWRGVPRGMLKKPAASYALRSEIDGVERFLPDSLGHLVRTGGVPPAALPRLLAEIAPELSKVDFKPMLRLNVRRNMRIAAAVALACLAGYLILRATATVPVPIGDRGPFYRMVLVTVGATGMVCLALLGPLAESRLRRRERQMAWAVERAAGPHG
jgi:hypothetical protein